MRSGTARSIDSAAFSLLLPCLLVLTLSSCARTPWTSALEGEARSAVKTSYINFISSQDDCRPSWDAEAEVRWSSSVSSFSFSGYGRMLEPSYLKFIVSNPLGQPVRVIVTNGTIYRDINTVERAVVSGDLRSWAVGHDLPLNLVHGPWLDWMGGRASTSVEHITEIRLDSVNRGAWLSMASADSEAIQEHILFDWENSRIIERILLDENNRTFATLGYVEWQEIDQCPYPVALTIDGLPLGGRVDLRFTDIRQSEFMSADFNVDIPRGYQSTWLP